MTITSLKIKILKCDIYKGHVVLKYLFYDLVDGYKYLLIGKLDIKFYKNIIIDIYIFTRLNIVGTVFIL